MPNLPIEMASPPGSRSFALALACLAAVTNPASAAGTQHAQGRNGRAAFADLEFDSDGDLAIDGSIIVRWVGLPPRNAVGVATGYGTVATAPIPGFADLGSPWVSIERHEWAGSAITLACRSVANVGDSQVSDSTYRTEISVRASCDERSYSVSWLYDALALGSHTSYRHSVREYAMTPAPDTAVNVAINGLLGFARATVCEPAAGWCSNAFGQDVWRLYDTNIHAARY